MAGIGAVGGPSTPVQWRRSHVACKGATPMPVRFPAGALVAAAVACAAVPPAGAQASTGTLSLTIDGNASAKFTAECRVRTGGSWQTHDFSGAPPFARRFDGEALSCEIRQLAPDGRMTVLAENGSGSVSRLSVSGAGGTARLRLD